MRNYSRRLKKKQESEDELQKSEEKGVKIQSNGKQDLKDQKIK